VSDMHGALNELARRGEPRGFDHVLAGAVDSAAVDVVARGAGGDDLDTIPFVLPEPVMRHRRPLGSAIAAAGIAALLLVGAFAVSAVVGSAGGSGSAEGAVRRLADAISHEDPLAAADVLAPDEVRSLHGTLTAAEQKARELQIVQTAGAPFAGVDFNVRGLTLSTESLGNGFAKVTIDSGTFSASTHKAQFSALMQRVLRDSHDNSSQTDLARLEQSKDQPTFVVVVREKGRWYVSAAYTVLEYIRESNHLAAADFGSGARTISTLGADSPDAAVQQSMRAIAAANWSKLMTLVPPSEIPVYDYRDALTTLLQRNNSTGDSTSGFRIDSMSTTSRVNGDVAEVTLKASGTTDSGHWSVDGGCFTPPYGNGERRISIGCRNGVASLSLLALPYAGLDQSSQAMVVKQKGRWFVSPVGTVLDLVDHAISRVDRRAAFTLLNIPDEIPPDGPLTLGRPIVLDNTTAVRGVRVLTFDAHAGESLLGFATVPASPSDPQASLDAAFVRVFKADGTELDVGGLLDGRPFSLPAAGRYTFVVETFDPLASNPTVTIWDAANAPAYARQSQNANNNGGTCTHGIGGSVTCTAVSAPTTVGGKQSSATSGVTVAPGG
jgi:hypothetical protein